MRTKKKIAMLVAMAAAAGGARGFGRQRPGLGPNDLGSDPVR